MPTERCVCRCKDLPPFTAEDIQKVERYLGLGLSPQDSDRLLEGTNVELREHCDITLGDPILTARIAISHLREDNMYYSKLKAAGL